MDRHHGFIAEVSPRSGSPEPIVVIRGFGIHGDEKIRRVYSMTGNPQDHCDGNWRESLEHAADQFIRYWGGDPAEFGYVQLAGHTRCYFRKTSVGEN